MAFDMAFEVTKVYRLEYPALRFIGIKYTNDDRKEGGFGEQWKEWQEAERFNALRAAAAPDPYDDAPIGLMTMRHDMTGFTYWIGLFYPEGTAVPDGFDSIDLPESGIGMGWVCGSNDNGEIFGAPPHEAVCKKLADDGVGDFRNDVLGEGSETYCFFERYDYQRFDVKDANGNVTLDYGNYFK